MDKQRNYTISNTTFQTHKTDTNQTSKICTYIKLVKWLELSLGGIKVNSIKFDDYC